MVSIRILGLIVTFIASAVANGLLLNAQSPTESNAVQFQAEMGLGGFWKVGYATRLVVDVKSGPKSIDAQLEIQTYDGEGVPVVYQSDSWRLNLSANSSTRIETEAKHGRGNRPIVVRIVATDGTVLLERALTNEERGTALPATQPWVVGIGSDKLGLAQGGMKSTRGALPEHSTVELTSPSQLPSSANCYGGVDLLVYSSRNKDLNERIKPEQATAVRDWIAQGGRCILTLGENSESWLQRPELAAMLPGEFKEVSRDCEPGPLESYLGSQSRLSNLTCCIFNVSSGTVDLESKTKNRVRFPLIARCAYGAGKLTVAAFELDSMEILDWESRPSLLKNFLNEQWEKKDILTEKRVYLGYDDLSGQLNSTLDRFPLLTLGNLTSLAILAGLFCLVIGPFDYFAISRGWRKPRGTWITLLICSVGCCALITGVASRWKPRLPTINSVEFLEMDYQTQTLRGRSFAHCYGGERGAFDFFVHRRAKPAATSKPATKVQLDWFGQPGRGLGGFESTVATDRGMPVYRIGFEAVELSDEKLSDASSEKSFGIRGVGIPAAGTKAMCATWQESVELARETNSLSMVSGYIDLLEGSFENPLDVDLLNGVLIYCGRAYALDTRIRVGQRVAFSSSTGPKDITRRLQRRQSVGGEERSTPWNPGDAEKMDRLMELISFHESSGGSKYTGLYNRYLSDLDCSDIIRLDRAILICELKDPSLTWTMRRNAVPIQASDGQRKTFLRLIIPVSKSKAAVATSGTVNPAIGTIP
ncbi:MAG: hypothetical protein NTY15_20650 [Planctomycetota bacterium]|nr:hypothetical protein [Planctomycetota bacterium]